MVERLKLTQKNMKRSIAKATSVLKAGGLVVYPTDTLYGLGCDALNEEAIRKVFVSKKRAADKPLSIAVSSLEMLKKYALVTPEAEALAKKFLPGALTLILPLKGLPGALTSGQENVAVRIPDSIVTLKLIESLGRPISATSANLSGMEPAITAAEATKQIDADLVLDGGRLGKRVPSTIVDLSGRPKLLREGKIKWREIKRVLNRMRAGSDD